jgi:hypothetical protein
VAGRRRVIGNLTVRRIKIIIFGEPPLRHPLPPYRNMICMHVQLRVASKFLASTTTLVGWYLVLNRLQKVWIFRVIGRLCQEVGDPFRIPPSKPDHGRHNSSCLSLLDTCPLCMPSFLFPPSRALLTFPGSQ